MAIGLASHMPFALEQSENPNRPLLELGRPITEQFFIKDFAQFSQLLRGHLRFD
jgi:hypothetical protein